jgi:hypothetical protein
MSPEVKQMPSLRGLLLEAGDMGPNMAKSGAESGAGNGQVHQPGHEPAKRVLLHRVFFGTQGLRAGWSALVFLLIFVALGTGAGKLTRSIVRTDRAQPVAPGSAILREVLQLAALFGATLIMAKIEKLSVFSYGFVDQSRLMRLATGTTAGFAAVSSLVGLLWLSHLLVFEGRVLGGRMVWEYAALWGVMFLIVAFFSPN